MAIVDLSKCRIPRFTSISTLATLCSHCLVVDIRYLKPIYAVFGYYILGKQCYLCAVVQDSTLLAGSLADYRAANALRAVGDLRIGSHSVCGDRTVLCM